MVGGREWGEFSAPDTIFSSSSCSGLAVFLSLPTLPPEVYARRPQFDPLTDRP